MWMQALLVLAVFALAIAPAGAGCPGKGKLGYDPETETTVTVVVEKVKEHACEHCWKGATGMHLMAKAGEDQYEILIGPAEFLKEKGFAIVEGDELEITGSRLKDEEGVILARAVRKADEELTLRDESGVPAWSRGKAS
jgi:hypothetical protein